MYVADSRVISFNNQLSKRSVAVPLGEGHRAHMTTTREWRAMPLTGGP